MKKSLLYFCCGIFAFSMLLMVHSCQKENRAVLSENRLVPLKEEVKTSNQYWMICAMGHDGSKCPGCVMINGKMVHIDCQGVGDACRKVSRISLQYSADSTLNASTLDTFGLTNLDVFNMPARSLSLEIEEGVYSYLNIPAQLVYRDTTTLQFTFMGLSFTSRPLY